MASISPTTFGVTGKDFTANGSVSIEVLNSSGSIVSVSSTTADSNGNFSVSLPSSQVLSIGQSSPGTYSGSVVAVDSFTGVSSNSVGITLNVTTTTTTTTTTSTPTPTPTPTYNMNIAISPTSISLTQGATVYISGSGFPPNSTGMISATPSGIGISGFTADANGNFDISVQYYFNASQVSGLGNAIQDAMSAGNIGIRAYDYSNNQYSNTVTLYF